MKTFLDKIHDSATSREKIVAGLLTILICAGYAIYVLLSACVLIVLSIPQGIAFLIEKLRGRQ